MKYFLRIVVSCLFLAIPPFLLWSQARSVPTRPSTGPSSSTVSNLTIGRSMATRTVPIRSATTRATRTTGSRVRPILPTVRPTTSRLIASSTVQSTSNSLDVSPTLDAKENDGSYIEAKSGIYNHMLVLDSSQGYLLRSAGEENFAYTGALEMANQPLQRVFPGDELFIPHNSSVSLVVQNILVHLPAFSYVRFLWVEHESQMKGKTSNHPNLQQFISARSILEGDRQVTVIDRLKRLEKSLSKKKLSKNNRLFVGIEVFWGSVDIKLLENDPLTNLYRYGLSTELSNVSFDDNEKNSYRQGLIRGDFHQFFFQGLKQDLKSSKESIVQKHPEELSFSQWYSSSEADLSDTVHQFFIYTPISYVYVEGTDFQTDGLYVKTGDNIKGGQFVSVYNRTFLTPQSTVWHTQNTNRPESALERPKDLDWAPHGLHISKLERDLQDLYQGRIGYTSRLQQPAHADSQERVADILPSFNIAISS